jgi:alpha-aminoadipic semialdehyde synthase
MKLLERTTTVENPYFTYDPISEREVASEITDSGITVLGVDILPSELPRESSEHFGNSAQGVIKEFLSAKEKQDKSVKGIDISLLSTGLVSLLLPSLNIYCEVRQGIL